MTLTHAEQSLLSYVLKGEKLKRIAADLGYSGPSAVHRARARLMKRIGVKDLVQLGAWAQHVGMEVLPRSARATYEKRAYRYVGLDWKDPEMRRAYNREAQKRWRASRLTIGVSP